MDFPDKYPDCLRLKEDEEEEGAEAEAEDALRGALQAAPAGRLLTTFLSTSKYHLSLQLGRIAAMDQGAVAVEEERKSGVEVKILRI